MLSGRDLWFFQTHTLSSVLWEVNVTAPSHLPAVRTCQPWKGTCGCGVSVHLALSQVLSSLRVRVITLSDALVHHGKLLHLKWASFQQGARATDQCQQIINIHWTKLLHSETQMLGPECGGEPTPAFLLGLLAQCPLNPCLWTHPDYCQHEVWVYLSHLHFYQEERPSSL